MPRLRLAVLFSGRGTNLANLIQASRDGRMDADIVLALSNRAAAGGVQVARKAGIDCLVVEGKGLERAAHEARLKAAIDEARPDLVLLAGYMRILSPTFIRHYAGRLVNIHPALLPAFPGLDAQEKAHERGVRIAGCTTHFVTEDVDAGPIILQAAVRVGMDDSPERLSARVLAAEHRVYPLTVQLFADGRVHLDGERVVIDGAAPADDDVVVSPEV